MKRIHKQRVIQAGGSLFVCYALPIAMEFIIINSNYCEGENMKRDLELVRKIMIKLEESPEPSFWGKLSIKDEESKKVDYHVDLMVEAGLLRGTYELADDRKTWIELRITNYGHDFLAAAKKDTVWHRFKERAGSEISEIPISVSVSILKEMTKEYFKETFGLK